ncbi:MAG: alkaline phosphatase family protein [Pirellulales bacterium]|nr:alkaline phosphatase family protein [Pirellulales bacterium]
MHFRDFVRRAARRLTANRLFLGLALVTATAVPLGTAEAAEFVVHISVDGLNAGYFQSLVNAGRLPNFARFQSEGAWTVNARTDYSHTITLPNHTSMLTGRPVTQPAGMPNTLHHGWTSNSDPAPTATLHNSGNPNVPYKASTFDVAHDAGLSTAHFASKTKFIIYEQSYNAAAGAPNPNGADKIDYFFADDDVPAMQSALLSQLSSQHFNYTFLHYANADNAGHSSGWGGSAWQSAVRAVDGYLGQLFDLVESDPVLAGRTALVLSADHGGTSTGHSTASNPENYTIPFMAWGAGVAHDDLYALNPQARTDPGASRIAYSAAGQPIRNGDGGNLALSLLGLGPIPGSFINAGQDLQVAQSGDFNGDGYVNHGDLAVWGDGFGAPSLASHAEGDAERDYDVDGPDFLRWQQLSPAPAAGAVPEPSAVALAALVAGALFTPARRGQIGRTRHADD